jgi:hypothetical protein
VIFLAVSSLLLSSCADLKLPPDQPISNRHRNPGSGDCTFRRGVRIGILGMKRRRSLNSRKCVVWPHNGRDRKLVARS